MRRIAGLLALVALLPGGASAGAPAPAQARDPVWSPDGTRLAYLRTEAGAGTVMVVGFRGGVPVRVSARFRSPHGLSWSPDGRSLALASGGDIWRVDVGLGRATRLTHAPQLGAFHPSWAPEGSTIAYAVFEGCFRCTRVYAMDATSGGNRYLVADGPRSPEWGRSSLLLTSYPVSLVDTTAGTSKVVSPSGTYAAWSGDRAEFAYFGGDARPGLYVSTPTRVAPLLVEASNRVLAHPAISPGHARIAFVRSGRVVLHRRWRHERDVALPHSNSANDAPAWSFRGQLAFVADGPCGPRSEIDVVRADGSRQHALVRACR